MSDGHALGPGTILGRRYIVLATEGREGDCLRYRAEEIGAQAVRTITEYFPDSLALRAADGALAPQAAAAAPPYEAGRERFLSRVHRLSQLAYPGLERPSAPIEDRNTAYAITAPVDGPTLGTWARSLGRAPTQGEIDALLAPVLDALAALHGAGLLHLAITPEAIVLVDGRLPVLTRLWAGAVLPVKAPVGASIAYAAPELLAGAPSEIGPRADIYALAATLHAVLTGVPPVASAPVVGETWIPPAIPTTGTDYRPEFLQALAMSLAPEPARRPPTAAALKSLLLEDALTVPPTHEEEEPQAPEIRPDAHIPAPDPPVADRLRRARVPWLVILLLGGGILAGLGYLGLRPMLPPPKGTSAESTSAASARGTTAVSERPGIDQVSPRGKKAPAQAGPEPDQRQQPVRPTRQRIAETTDREDLLRIAGADPALRGDVEARLVALGYLRLATRDATIWLRPGDGESFRECDDCPDMLALAAGTFAMGSPGHEPGRQDDEDDSPGPGGNPVSVTIARPFAIGKHEVTRSQFAAFVKATGYRVEPGCFARELRRQLRSELSWTTPGFEQDDGHPVTCVSWRDASQYVQWLSATTGAAYRLPTEAEWEYAARAGSSARYAFGDNELEICKYANGADLTSREADPDWIVAPCRDGYRFTAPAGSFTPNVFGLFDMHGNLWEWVEDCASDSLQHLSRLAAASGADASRSCASDAMRILRGGSWSDPPRRLRSAARIAGPSDTRDHIVGFRVARSLPADR